MSVTLLDIATIAGLTLALLALWLLATRFGRDLLRPGHGPLWVVGALGGLAAYATVSILATEVLAAPDLATAMAEELGVAARGRGALLTQLASMLLVIVAVFALARLTLAIFRRPKPLRAPVPRMFLLGGVAPDGSTLPGARRALQWLSGLLLVLGLATLPVLDHGADTSGWAAAYGAALALFFAFTHPSAKPASGEGLAYQPKARERRRPLEERVGPIHAWLGEPREIERLPRVPGAPAAGPRVLGLTPTAWQRRLLERAPSGVALSGPLGSGRSTAALMLAARDVLSSGRTALFIAPTRDEAKLLAGQLRRRLDEDAAGLALSLETGDAPRDADVWVASPLALERFADAQARLDVHEFVSRLGVVVVEDVEGLSGAGIPLVRFLVHRISAGAAAEPRIVVTGRLGPVALARAARSVAAREVEVWPTSGEDAPGLPSLEVRRYVVEAGLEVDEGPGAEVDGVEQQLSRKLDACEVTGEVSGAPWRTLRAGEGDDIEVRLVRVGPDTAWHTLGARASYPGEAVQRGEHAREYLVFGRDPMARRLAQAGWPGWFDRSRFPRMLTAVPGELDAPRGLRDLARLHLWRALDEAPQSRDRLDAVFSAPLVERELAAARESGLVQDSVGWRVVDGAALAHPLVWCSGALERLDGPAEGRFFTLREPRSGVSFTAREELRDLVYHDRAVVVLDGRRYEVREQADGSRTLAPAPLHASTPVRRTRVLPAGDLVERHHRYEGRETLVTLSGRMCLRVRHFGTRQFTTGQRRVQETLLPEARELPPFVTTARALCPPDNDPRVLHTLAHLLREVLGYFYLGAERSVGVTWEADLAGRPAIVLYDLHPDGLGFVGDMDEGWDWRALLLAARELLADCECQAHCAHCCESSTCTDAPHNHELDRQRTMQVLDQLLTRRAEVA